MTIGGLAAQPPACAGRVGLQGWLVPALAFAVVALVGGLLLGRGTVAQDVPRATDPVSLGFVRDMSVHHAQAVAMSAVAHRRSADPELGYVAFDILSTQQAQIGIMSGWLELWQQPPGGSDAAMAWRGHTGPMPGMAAPEEIAALDRLPVPEMEEQFLRLMVRHHLGAVPMADAAASRAASAPVAALAKTMSLGQQSEVDSMQRMLVARGHAPEPTAVPHSGAHAGAAPATARAAQGHGHGH